MKALIMAAGKGTRISRHIESYAKCAVSLGKFTLIEHTLNTLKKKGFIDIAIVVGYEADYIKLLLKNENVTYYYNPFYDVTNSIASLWFAKEFVNKTEDILLLNGDVFFEDSLLDIVINEKKSPVIFADETRKTEADYKLYYENNILKKYGKELSGVDITGEYIGIAKITKRFIPKVINKLNELITKQQHDLWWENVIYFMTNEIDIYVKDINNKFWAEVDYIEDYQRILEFIKVNNLKNEKNFK